MHFGSAARTAAVCPVIDGAAHQFQSLGGDTDGIGVAAACRQNHIALRGEAVVATAQCHLYERRVCLHGLRCGECLMGVLPALYVLMDVGLPPVVLRLVKFTVAPATLVMPVPGWSLTVTRAVRWLNVKVGLSNSTVFASAEMKSQPVKPANVLWFSFTTTSGIVAAYGHHALTVIGLRLVQ